MEGSSFWRQDSNFSGDKRYGNRNERQMKLSEDFAANHGRMITTCSNAGDHHLFQTEFSPSAGALWR